MKGKLIKLDLNEIDSLFKRSLHQNEVIEYSLTGVK